MLKLFRRSKKNNKGFTLVELIVVIAIMAILAVAVTPKLTQFLDKSKIATDKEIANTICTAFTSVSLDEDAYATIPSSYRGGVNILIPTDTGKDNKFYFTKSATSYEYTATDGTISASATTSTLNKFEKAVMDILPTKFTLKSNQWAKSGTTCIVTVTGEGIVTVVLANGSDTYTVSKN